MIVDDFFAIKYVEYNSSPFALLMEIHSEKLVFFISSVSFSQSLKTFISTNFDYTINCAKILQSEYSTQWIDEVEAQSYLFNSTSRQHYVVA